MARRYGWIPDRADPRDHLYAAPRRIFGLPRSTDLRKWCSPVEDQGQTSSCTGNAAVGALELLEIKTGTAFTDLSRFFPYWQARAYEGTPIRDQGAEIRDVVKALSKVGTCDEKLWPFKARSVNRKPTPAAFDDAEKRLISSYQRVVGLQQMKAALADGFPVVFGISIFESFESDEVARDGMVPMPEHGERELGGHAILAVGYDDGTQRVTIRNSWGPRWGDQGYCYLPYAYVMNASLSDDAWTIRK